MVLIIAVPNNSGPVPDGIARLDYLNGMESSLSHRRPEILCECGATCVVRLEGQSTDQKVAHTDFRHMSPQKTWSIGAQVCSLQPSGESHLNSDQSTLSTSG